MATDLWQKLTTRPIKWRLTIAYAAIIYFVMTAAGLTLSHLVESEYTAAYRRVLASHALLVSNLVEDHYRAGNINCDSDRLCRDLSRKVNARVQMVSTDGKTIIADSRRDSALLMNPSADPSGRLKPLTCRVCHSEARSLTEIYGQHPIIHEGSTIGLARVSSSLFPVKQASARTRRIMFAALVIAVMLAAALSQRFASSIARPVAYMSSVAKNMAEGDLNQRVKVTSTDEIGQLGESFNAMADRLQQMLSEMVEDRNKMETILTTMTDGIVVTDELGRIVLFNKGAEEVFGLQPDMIIDRYVGEAKIHPELAAMMEETLLTGRLVRKDLRLKLSERSITVNAYSSTVRNEASVLKGAVLVLHDLTEIKKHEKSQKEFVANVSHELRTPITSIRLTAEALLSGAKDNPQLLDRFLATLVKESERLSLLIDDLLEIAKREAGTRVPRKSEIELQTLIYRVCAMHKAEAVKNHIKVSFQAPEDLMLYADEQQISQVIANLVDNAVKYTPSGGKVLVTAVENGNNVSIGVTDTGIGIPNAEVPHIFERFYRVDKARSRQMGGTGLGLSIVKDIVEAHGGTITVETEIDGGSTFMVTIPNSSSSAE